MRRTLEGMSDQELILLQNSVGRFSAMFGILMGKVRPARPPELRSGPVLLFAARKADSEQFMTAPRTGRPACERFRTAVD